MGINSISLRLLQQRIVIGIMMAVGLRQGGKDALNIYTTTAGGNLGYAYYPDGAAGASYDGTVLAPGTVGSAQFPGKTSTSLLTHTEYLILSLSFIV